MRELLEERKRKLEELKQKNSQSPSGTSAGINATPERPSATLHPVGTRPTQLSSPAAVPSPANVLSMVNALIPPNSTAGTVSPSTSTHPSLHVSRVYRSQLSVQVGVAGVDISPKELPMHGRGAQTDPSLLTSFIESQALPAVQSLLPDPVLVSQGEHRPAADADEEEPSADTGDASASIEAHDKELLRRHPTLSSPHQEPLVNSAPFVGFLKRCSPLMEQAMSLQDRFLLRASVLDSLDDASSRPAKAGRRAPLQGGKSDLTLLMTLHDDQHTKDHEIYDINWNPADASRLISACYSPVGGSGVIEWNLEYEGKLESRHHCPSRITAARYWDGADPLRTILPDHSVPTNQNLIIGGSYTGQIVVWDMKAASYRPIVTLSHASLSSSFSTGASPHQHPIYSIVTIDSHLFATADTMGLMAIWDMNKLQQPIEVLSLSWTAGSVEPTAAPAAAQQEISATSMCFRDDNTFYVTSEDGGVFQGQRHGEYRGLIKALARTHEATITASDLHPSPSPVRLTGRSVPVSNNFSDLLLTASADWSVSLWSPRSSVAALHRFSYFSDYVLDVAWAPSHPALFAACDGSGTLSVWNLNRDLEIPVAIDRSSAAAVNKLSWNPHVTVNGPAVLAGAPHHSNVHIYELSRDVAAPEPGDWTQMDALVTGWLDTSVPAQAAGYAESE